MSNKETPECPYCGEEIKADHDDHVGMYSFWCVNSECPLNLMTYETEESALAAAQLRPVLRYAGEMRDMLERIDADFNKYLDISGDPVSIDMMALLAKTKEVNDE